MASWKLSNNIIYEGNRTGPLILTEYEGDIEFINSHLYTPERYKCIKIDLNKWHEYWKEDDGTYIFDNLNDWPHYRDPKEFEILHARINRIRTEFYTSGKIKCPVLDEGDGTRVVYDKGRCTTKLMLEIGLNFAFFMIAEKRLKYLESHGILIDAN